MRAIPTLEEFTAERKKREKEFQAYLKMIPLKYWLDDLKVELRREIDANPPKRVEYNVLISGKDDSGKEVTEEAVASDEYSWQAKHLALVNAELERREKQVQQRDGKDKARKNYNTMKTLAFGRGQKYLKEHMSTKTVPMPLVRDVVKEVQPELEGKALTDMAKKLRSQTQRSLKQSLKRRRKLHPFSRPVRKL